MNVTYRGARGALVCAVACCLQPAVAQVSSSLASHVEEQGKMSSLAVTDMRASRRDNLMHIQVEITNSSNSNQQLYYRFKWLDQDGFSVWDEEPWKPVLLYGAQKTLINVVAPTFKAADFRLVLQSPDNKGQ